MLAPKAQEELTTLRFLANASTPQGCRQWRNLCAWRPRDAAISSIPKTALPTASAGVATRHPQTGFRSETDLKFSCANVNAPKISSLATYDFGTAAMRLRT